MYDIIVVGGGHAGIEAAAAGPKLGCKTLLVSLDKNKIGALSCNPAVGGVGKGQLVKEVDALGGLMGEITDQVAIQYRCLNSSRGPAVHSSRMQVDMEKYPVEAQRRLAGIKGLEVTEDEAVAVGQEKGFVTGVVLKAAGPVRARTVILTPGTFFHGLIHIGEKHFSGGRMDDPASDQLPENLAGLGLKLGRFKTGTTPRLKGDTIDFSVLSEQPGDSAFITFSRRTKNAPVLEQRPCFLGRTSQITHKIIRDNLKRSALYSGIIKGTGVRYCPSL